MKKITVLAFALVALSAFSRVAAADNSTAVSSDLGRSSLASHSTDIAANLDYFFRTRASFSSHPLCSQPPLSDQTFLSGTPVKSTATDKISTSSTTLTATYGVTNRLRVSLAESALIGTNNTRLSTVTGATTSTSSSGFSDPTLGASFRYLDDDAQSGLSADIALSVSPSLVDRDVANSAQNGSDGKGIRQ